MENSIDLSGQPFHFIGIGGIGMSALAYILAKRQVPVYGSDIHSSHITERLQDNGAHIFWRQDANNLEFFRQTLASGEEAELPTALNKNGKHGLSAVTPQTVKSAESVTLPASHLPQVICSTAIDPANSEYRAALELGCPVFHRSELLAALISEYQSIAVAGTHGKTTTSSMMAYMLLEARLDPTIVVGGEVKAWEGNARLGDGPYLVAEADESDGSLAKLSAYIGVVTNIELDHPDHYQNLDEVVDIFKVFKKRCQHLVGCIDCETVSRTLQPDISYSLDIDSDADYRVDCVAYRPDSTTARVWEGEEILGQLSLPLLGQHNLSNALAVVAVGRLLGLEFSQIASAIATFEGARRRFECRGEYNGIQFVDDYAHHPSEIRATLKAASLVLPSTSSPTSGKQRVVAVFQPHRYSRTKAFLSEFAEAFSDADLVVVTDIYSAGEPNLAKISGQQVADSIAQFHPQVYYQGSLEQVSEFLNLNLLPGDLVLFLGAGNLNQIIPEVMAFHQLSEQHRLERSRYRA
ncbi:UDP-N-acetylmuramate--L-alanine ligase [Phormidium sp. CCY1219]|uniref:UDP-N-acetylmuramate--L-alanine ligase n=1 Tax=Phormidium sp. CCY1219 TaxID=2886104 RepID=UPI002D1F7147|nr:UDP-N-acetylmuramate--L-alanine ligase [Phormidium sp. CCY1219]MEB3828021.1 UDP-N-acetylmuramate--L-alanine ligase [Phormidium sp. CCY1219]